jgi:hypothetical protein
MEKKKFIFIVTIISIILSCPNIFATYLRPCSSNHDSRVTSGECSCDNGTCGGCVIMTYNYICVHNTCPDSQDCGPNGVEQGIVGYQYSCKEVSCGSNPGICTNNYDSYGTSISGSILHCACI